MRKSPHFALAALLTFSLMGNMAFAQITFSDLSSIIDFERESFVNNGDGLAGAAWFDYNNDGQLDLFLTNGRGNEHGLFHNNGDGTFTDRAADAGITGINGATGVIAADIDNDGFMDIFLSGDGGMMGVFGDSETRLYHNKGDGTFDDITTASGVVGGLTTLSAAFGDIDNDGFVDLFVSACGSLPNQSQHPNVIYRNNGDLTFDDISEASGIDTALGACIAFFSDYNNDCFTDLFIGNCNDIELDSGPVQLYRNNGDGTFTDIGPATGLDKGLWMGFAPGDFDNDLDFDIFVTNVGSSYANPDSSTHAFYRNNGDGTYTDIRFDLDLDTLPWGWGAVADDYDNDGWLDIFFVGSMPVLPFNIGCIGGEDTGNPGIFLMNNKEGGFIYSTGPTDMRCDFTSGLASGDYDQDGWVDLVTAAEPTGGLDGKPFLFHNDGGSGNNWIGFKLNGTSSNRSGIGARVFIEIDTIELVREIYGGSSFISMNMPWVHFGIGDAPSVDRVRVVWPGCDEVIYTDIDINEYNQLNQDGSVGIFESNLIEGSLDLYPNPAQDEIQVQFEILKAGEYHLRIVDLQGKFVWTEEHVFAATPQQIRVDLESLGLAPGMYLMELRSEDSRATQRFSVQ